jgi:ATP-dependent Clp protease adapter protein ClpS
MAPRLTKDAEELVDAARALAASLGHARVSLEHVGAAIVRHQFGGAWLALMHVSVVDAKAILDQHLPALNSAYRSGPPRASDENDLDAWLLSVKKRRGLRGMFGAIDLATLVGSALSNAELRTLLHKGAFDVTEIASWVHRAQVLAAERKELIVTVHHALLAACDEPNVRRALAAADQDVEKLAVALRRTLSLNEFTRPEKLPSVETLCQRACAIANASGARTISTEALLVQFLKGKSVRDPLRELGSVDVYDVLFALVHGRAQATSNADAGATVIAIHNDDYSTMEFVTDVLITVLHLESAAARALMMRIHEEGHAEVELRTPEDTDVALRAIQARARAENMPLRVEPRVKRPTSE